MSQNDQTELYMDDSTTPVEVLEFVTERTANPAIMRDGEVVVYNYYNQPLLAHALSGWAQDAEPGVYVQPYQVPGVWVFIQRVLPQAIRDGDLLAYRRGEDRYVDYPNWRREYVRGSNVELSLGEGARNQLNRIEREVMEVLGDGV